ncbi:family 20 glycosylhydrolase [Sporosarcina sp. E16_3]|uniref:family 20 glycosylhydrolase n=1 Tax=Sporosarcina sp. E16_3 TaxID=2789293 RepID=UPI001A92D294|nr:family 20 glycosylhydrolase [Sporosarcina sp. E16_3]MBO0600590.1 family 20 glycosylhydrolase [Sporosarcina sp. E16_3]
MTSNKPVRAFHLRFGSHEDVEPFKNFIQKVLVPKGINQIILECNMSFKFESHPELSEGTLNKTDAKELAALCKRNGIRLIPLFQCLGHQGWGGARNSILKHYPEFDETPHIPVDAEWPEFFCPSWCPLHPDVNALAFDLMDELINAFDADAFHIGMDEVFALADDQCPRCKGKDRAELFAKAVNDMYDHLVNKRGVQMYMWGDRLIDSDETGYNNKFEADTFGTSKAVDLIPKDIIITDWHYLKHEIFPSIGIFLEKGFTVIPACWFDTESAVNFLADSQRQARELGADDRMPGMVMTTWHHWNKEEFERFASPEKLDGEMRELAETIDIISSKLI